MKSVTNAFSRLGEQNDVLSDISENTKATSESVAIGGDLYERVNELTTAITDLRDGKGGGGMGLQNAMAIALVAPSIGTIGKGLQFVVDAVNNLQGTGDEVKAKTEALVGGLTMLGDVGKSILQFAGYMALATPLLLVAMIGAPLIAISLFLLTTAVNLATKKLEKEQLEKVQMLGDVGKSILILMGTLALSSLIAPFALKGLGTTLLVVGLFALITYILPEDKVEALEKFGDGMLKVALGLGAMVAVLALTSLIIGPALKGLLGAVLIIAAIGGVFYLLESMGIIDKIEDGAKGLLFAAGAILGLGVALALFDIITPPLDVLLEIALVVGAVALMFGVVGIFQKQIYNGARALAFAALSIFVLGLALLFFTKVVGANIGGEDLLNSFAPLLLIGAIGVAFAIAGNFKSQIIQGAMAFIIGSVALIMLGVGVMLLSKGLGDSPLATIGWTLAFITGLGLVMAAAGVAAAFILPGAAALMVAGGALLSVGIGVLVMSKAYAKSGDMLKPNKDGVPGLVSLLTAIADGFVMWPWTAAGILLGSGAMIGAGVALITIGLGLTKFAKIVESGIDLAKLGADISLMIGTLAIPFQKIGAGEEMEVLDADGNKTTVKFGGGGGGLFGLGGSNPVAMGISSVLRMGTALSNIAGGVQNMANLKFPTGFDKDGKPTGYETIGGDAFKKVITNTMMMVGSLAVPFAAIGAGGKQTITMPDGTEKEVDFGAPSAGGLMGFLKGGGDVQKGIKAVMNMGQALSNIAGGVQDMALLKFPTGFDAEGKPTGYRQFDLAAAAQVTLNTHILVSALSSTFASIGSRPDAQGDTWWGGQSNITKGIEIVAGIGEPLLNLAKGVQAMADLKFPIYNEKGEITGYEQLPTDPAALRAKVGTNTQLLIQALTDTFTLIGSNNSGATSSWWQGTTSFEKGIEIVELISDPYKKLGDSVKTVIEIVKDLDGDAFAKKIQAMIGVFSSFEVLTVRKENVETVAMIADPYRKLGDSADSINKILTIKATGEQLKAKILAVVNSIAEAPALDPGETKSKLEFIDKIKKMYSSLSSAVPDVKTIIEGISEGPALKIKIKNILSAITESPVLGVDDSIIKAGFIYTVRRMYANLAGAVPSAITILMGITDGEALKLKIKQMIEAIVGPAGDDIPLIMAKGSFMNTLGRVYMKLAIAIPPIVAAMNAFAVEKGKAFTSIFGGETPADMYESKRTLFETIAKSYTKMAIAIPLIIGSVGTVEAETMDTFTKIYGGSLEQVDVGTLNARTALFTEIGNSYEKIGKGSTEISNAMNNSNMERLAIWKDMFVGPVNIIRPGMGYRYQEKLWNAIGKNMVATGGSYTTIAEAINSMDLTKLVEARQMFQALSVLAEGGESPEDILEAMGESLEAALQNLADMLQQFNNTVAQQGEAQGNILKDVAGIPGDILGGIKNALSGGGGGGSVDSAQIVNAITQLQTILVSRGIKVNTNDFG